MSEDFKKSKTLLRNGTLRGAFEKLRDREPGKGLELTNYEAEHLFEFLKIGVRVRDEVEVKRNLENALSEMRRDYVREGNRNLAKDIEWQNTTVRVEREKLEKMVNGAVGGYYW